MIESINTPFAFAILFSLLSVLGGVPLLRWALAGGRADTYGEMAIGAALSLAALSAFGRPETFLQFGLFSLPVMSGASCVLLAILFRNTQSGFMKAVVGAGVGVFAFLGCLGFPIGLEQVSAAGWGHVLVLSLVLGMVLSRTFWAALDEKTFDQGHVGLLVINVCLIWISFVEGDQGAITIGVSLVLIVIALQVWRLPRFDFQMGVVSSFPIALGTALLMWHLWGAGVLPLLSVFCLMLCLFAHQPYASMRAKYGLWLNKISFVLLFCLAAIPAAIALFFVEILKKI